jgi:ferrochelatase
LVATAAGRADWTLAYQSRSGPPSDPWLEPDILDVIRDVAAQGSRSLVIVPIGFISDHMEVLYDLDTEALQVASGLGVPIVRAATAGSHPRFVRMIRELVEERIHGLPPATAGSLPAAPDHCPPDCCPPPRRPALIAVK